MLPAHYLEPWDCYCPCCGKRVKIRYWDDLWVDRVCASLPRWSGKSPCRVLCISESGKPVREGYAVTYRCCKGPISVGILPKPGAWRQGWWWPLDRVLWEVEEGV